MTQIPVDAGPPTAIPSLIASPAPPEASPPGNPSMSTKRRRRAPKYDRREAVAGYLFILPWVVGFLVFTLGSMIYSLVISFTHYNLATGTAPPAGTANYQRLLHDPLVRRSLENTLFYAILAVPLEVCFALLLACLLDGAGRRSAGTLRTIYYLPKMTPMVATASMFLLLLNGNTGAVNQALHVVGINGPQWLVDPAWVRPSIVLMTLWNVAGTMVIFLAALKNVPRELYEVAALDGAGPVRRFMSITLPQISGAMLFNVIILTIAAFQVFDQAFLLFWRDQSNASPDTSLFYAVYLFQQAFRQFNFGFAAAMAWLMFLILVVLSLIQVKIGNRFVYYEGDR